MATAHQYHRGRHTLTPLGPALFGRWERPVGDGRWWIMVKMQFAAPSVPVPSCSEEISVWDHMDEKSLM